MDTLVFCDFLAIFLPFFAFLFLAVSRIKLAAINKKLLNNLSLIVSSFAFFVYLIDFKMKNYNVICDYQILNFENVVYETGLKIDESNIVFLIITSFLFMMMSIFIKHYFNSKKQFIFVKQRYIAYFFLLIFNTFCFLASFNLLTSLIFWIIQGVIIFLFCFVDIKKKNTKTNITRFHKITILGDFSLFTLILLLFKYEILSQGYIVSSCLNYNDFDLLISYTYGISSSLEFKFMLLCLILAATTKLIIFPFNCYFSFLSNCSNIICYPIYLINSIFGAFLLTKAVPFISLLDGFQRYTEIYCAASILILAILLLFEKNIKIIFGNLFAILNCIFLYTFLFFEFKYIPIIYFGIIFVLFVILSFFFYKDKNNFSRRIINIQKGFLTERIYILLFEKSFDCLYCVIDFIKNDIIDKILHFPFRISSFLSGFLAYTFAKLNKNKERKGRIIIRYIFIIFVIFILFVLLISLFEESRC